MSVSPIIFVYFFVYLEGSHDICSLLILNKLQISFGNEGSMSLSKYIGFE